MVEIEFNPIWLDNKFCALNHYAVLTDTYTTPHIPEHCCPKSLSNMIQNRSASISILAGERRHTPKG